MAPARKGRGRSAATDVEQDPSSPEQSPARASGRRPAAKSLHIPPFQSKDVKFWFFQLEALFRTARVTDDQSKFDYVVQALDLTAASDIRDLLENPPQAELYKTIKTKLIERLAVSEEKRIQRLLSNELMGDRTPSQHLRHLRGLAGANFSDAVLVSIWTSALPANIRPIVAGNEELSLDKRASMADRILDVTGHSREVASATQEPTPKTKDYQIAALTKQVNALTKRFDAIAKSKATSGPSKAKVPRSSSPHPKAKTVSDRGLCWYHKKYKGKAQKCAPGCTWTGSSSETDSEN